MLKFLSPLMLLLAGVQMIRANGFISGSLQSSTNFFIRDPKIGAADLPHYDNYKIGTQAWLNLNYTNPDWGLEIGSRVDLFYNSIVQNPTQPFTGAGLGIFYIKKEVKDLKITGGYFYEQIGTGMAYRSWEERFLGIDNALLGGRLEYNVKDKLYLKAFTGVQKFRFQLQKQIVTGFNAESNLEIGKKVRLKPSFGLVNRSMDESSMNTIVSRIEAMDTSKRFVPKYNAYVFTFYNTLDVGDFSWYIEGAYKTKEALNGLDGNLFNDDGNILYTTLSYSRKGFGINLQFKRAENWQFRTSPNQILFNGLLSFMPPVPRQNSLRLPARYFANSLELRELAFGGEITFTPLKHLTFTLAGSEVRDLIFKPALTSHKNYFREAFAMAAWKPTKQLELELGFQYLRYNRVIYIGDGATDIDGYTPFAEIGYKINKKMSVRMELQYQSVKKDFGQWIYGLLEFNIAPHWSFAVSDMWNFKPNPDNLIPAGRNPNHYYSVFAAYNLRSVSFTLNYVKQVEGIVCTGGVCRFEPAFSGVKFGVNSTF